MPRWSKTKHCFNGNSDCYISAILTIILVIPVLLFKFSADYLIQHNSTKVALYCLFQNIFVVFVTTY